MLLALPLGRRQPHPWSPPGASPGRCPHPLPPHTHTRQGGWVRRTGQKQPRPPKPPAQAVEGCPWLAVPQETPQDALSPTPGGTRTLQGARCGDPTGETPLLPSPVSPQARLGTWAVGGLSRCRARLSPMHAGQKAWQPLPAPFYPQRLSRCPLSTAASQTKLPVAGPTPGLVGPAPSSPENSKEVLGSQPTASQRTV